jgi:hypothetical protein
MTKTHIRTYLTYLILLAVILALNLSARHIPGFAEWYAVTVYPVFPETVSRLFSLVPFSVVEIGLYLLIAAALFFLFRGVYQVCRRRRDFFDFGASCIRRLLLFAELLLLVYTMTCGINYHRTPFSEAAGFTLAESSAEELADLCRHLAGQANQLSGQMLRDADGCMIMPVQADVLASQAMENLGKRYPCLAGYYPRPKVLLVSEILSCQQLSGVYSPFTIEANVNGDMTAYNLAPTMCHELSHLKGFMREDEANFIAYLACRYSDNAAFQYGGTLFAYIYASNALYSEDPDAWREIRGTLAEGVLTDLAANDAFWERYESPISEISDKVNDTYLKLNDQIDGVKSYGRMVDLLLADYRSGREER